MDVKDFARAVRRGAAVLRRRHNDNAGRKIVARIIRQHRHTDFSSVVDRGRIFVRYKQTEDAYGPYGAWSDIGAGPGGAVVTAGLLADGRQQVFALDKGGAPFVLSQNEGTLTSRFGTWRPWPAESIAGLTDIECGHTNSGSLRLFASSEMGNIWISAVDKNGTVGTWGQWSGPTFVGKGLALATTSQISPRRLSLLLLTTAEGKLQASETTDDAWGAWTEFY